MPCLYVATYGRFFAWVYDGMLRQAERAGLRAMRAELLANARGRTLEIGAGTGLNLAHYPTMVTDLVLTEPSPHMARGLRHKIEAGGIAARVIEATAERLPFEDSSCDTVVATLVLCTVSDPAAALEEISRVLRPEGQLLFLEHVRSTDARFALWQDRLAGVWRWVADGCHCNRDTRALIARSPLFVETMKEVRLPRMGALVRPAIIGLGRRAR